MSDCAAQQAFDNPHDTGPAALRTVPPLIEVAYHLTEARAKLIKHLPKLMTHDSALDMLLDLFIGEFENRDLCVKQLALDTGDTHATAIRIINDLENSGMIERHTDESDRRRTIVSLSHLGRAVIIKGLEPLVTPLSNANHAAGGQTAG